MAHIFKRSIIKQKVAELRIVDFDKKLAIIESWHKAYQDKSLYKKSEGQCEQAFNDDVFKKILGYTEYPSQPHTIIPQLSPEKGGQRADAGLGWFDGKRQRVFAVVEIKDVNKSLDRSQQREGNLTPIQQAFKYKPLFKDCRFVIATNFYEIRLFQDNQLDYEQFTLKSLCDPANDYFELKKFILLLGADNFVSGRGKSKTEELLAEIRIEQEKISKDFYSEYSDLRLHLMRDIWKNNTSKRDIHLVTDKAQKLLDRIVFVSFCEDTGLLPDNTLHKVFMHSESSFSSVWDTLKGFFRAVDSGSDKLGIPQGYNGGLFHEDTELNELKLSDEVLKSLGKIGRYDFENELTVNILGHVFEQSISDLEEIKQKIDPDEASKKSKRKKDGIFYTPEYIVDYIVQNSLGKYLRENEELIFEKNQLSKARTEKTYREREQKALQEYQDFLHTVKVVDPACGSGAFLVKVFDYLLEENRRVGELIGGLFSQDQVYKDILKNNIYGVDLNEESVRITQLSLWLKTAQRGKKLTYLDKNIRVGNSLIDDYLIAGSKSFSWEEEFKEVFDAGGFDVVVGNPPYVSSRDTKMSIAEKGYYSKNYTTLKDKPNTYLLFTEKFIKKTKKNGYFSFIIPNAWMGIDSAELLRKYLLFETSVKIITNIPGYSFDGVNVETVIIVIKKEKSEANEVKFKTITDNIYENSYLQVKQLRWASNRNYLFDIRSNDDDFKLIQAIKSESLELQELFTVKSGLQAYEVGKGNPRQTKEDVKNHIYDRKHKESEETFKYLQGRDVDRFKINWTGDWLLYGDFLSQPRSFQQFSNPRVLVREITGSSKNKLLTCFTEKIYLNNKSIISILENDGNEKKLKCLSVYLNSRLCSYFFERKAVKANRSLFPKLVIADIKHFPVHKNLMTVEDKFSKFYDRMTEQEQKFADLAFSFTKTLTAKITTKSIKTFDIFSTQDKLLSSVLKHSPLEISDDLTTYVLKFITQRDQYLETKETIENEVNTEVSNLFHLSIEEIDVMNMVL